MCDKCAISTSSAHAGRNRQIWSDSGCMQRSAGLRAIATRLAAAQGGAISRDQLVRTLGWSAATIRTQLDAQRWQQLFPGVYSVTTGEPSITCLWWAAHLCRGESSALTGESALQAWGVSKPMLPVELWVPSTSSARTVGITIRRSVIVPQIRRPPGLPPAVVTQLALLIVAERLGVTETAALVSSCCQKGLVSPLQIEDAMQGQRIRHRQAIVEVLAEFRSGATTPLEIAGSRRILKAHGLPMGEGQVRSEIARRPVVRDRVVHGLVIEFDGRLGHADPRGRFRDLSRDNQAMLLGMPTLRFGWTDVHQQPCAAADQVHLALAQLGFPATLRPCSPNCACRNLPTRAHSDAAPAVTRYQSVRETM